jgi:hypothetical protein
MRVGGETDSAIVLILKLPGQIKWHVDCWIAGLATPHPFYCRTYRVLNIMSHIGVVTPKLVSGW